MNIQQKTSHLCRRDHLPAPLNKGGEYSLRNLVTRIIELVESIAWWEKQLFSHPDHFEKDGLCRYSVIDLCQKIADSKRKVIKSYEQFSKLLTSHGGKVKLISFLDKKDLECLLEFISLADVSQEWIKLVSSVSLTIKKIMHSLIQKRETADDNLKPSAFFQDRKEKWWSVRRFFLKNQDVLIAEHQSFKDKATAFIANGDRTGLEKVQREIFCLLDGIMSVEELPLTKNNCRQYLTHLKIIDQALAEHKKHYRHSSFELRTKILGLASPLMTTCEVYTITLDSKKYNDKSYLKNPFNWIPERTALHAKLYANQLIQAAAYSHELNRYCPSITVLAGNTASGKSHTVAEDHISVSLKADTLKYYLKVRSPINKAEFLINSQVHKEGSAIFDSFRNDILVEAVNGSIIIEGRLSTLEEIEKTILAPARWNKKENKDVNIVYYIVPLETSLIRVLTRNPYGEDPCPPLKDIVTGYKESLRCCKELIRKVGSSDWQWRNLKDVKIVYTDLEGNRGTLTQDNSCLQLPPEHELERQLNQVITKTFIEDAISKQKIPGLAKSLLEPWIGMPLGRAVQYHAAGIQPLAAMQQLQQETLYLQKYGKVERVPFSSAWLKDYPQIVDHIQTEQTLHIRGVDEQGQGLHWPTNKFTWDLNPAFNPDACFQMKLGYFIIPQEQIEKLFSQSLSPQVLKELEFRNGYRFFVHPEAYEHFKFLHEANIPFVKPEDSEYMGTPTSSYRSWVVRRLNHEDSIPFIVKMGVLGSSGSTGRLLPSPTIQHSLQTQQALDHMDSGYFEKKISGTDLLLFKETLGLTLKNIPHYPPCNPCDSGPVDSGMIIREFPKDLLEGNCKIYSFSALMSLERLKKENRGIGSIANHQLSIDALPLIYELIHAAMEKGLVKYPYEFVNTCLIKRMFDALEDVVFKAGFSLAMHGQNFCIVLNKDNTPRGFAYRDFEGIATDGRGFIQTSTWFGRFHLYIKLLSVITRLGADIYDDIFLDSIYQAGEKSRERSLYYYLKTHFEKNENLEALELLKKLSLDSHTDTNLLLESYDKRLLRLLSKYFDFSKVSKVPDTDNNFSLPAAESGSVGEKQMVEMSQKLWQHRFY